MSSLLLITPRKWASVKQERKKAKQALDVSCGASEYVEVMVVCAPVGFVSYNFALKFRLVCILACVFFKTGFRM